jgi:hypothetical protein
MKKLVFPILGVLMLYFSGCNKPGDNIQNLELPAIVGMSWETFQPTMITSLGTFLAPELSSADFFEGEAIWAYFSVNYDQPNAYGEYIAYDLYALKVETGWTQSTVGGESMAGDYDLPIENMWVADLIGNMMFFIFEHRVSTDQKMLYELTYDGSETSDPVVYIRAKKDYTEGTASVGTLNYPFAFNMSSVFGTYKDSDNWVRFRIKYKTGVDDDENDQYGDFNQGTLIEIKVE